MQRRIIIISGGQSGVDRAALDVAIARGIPYGGWCPRDGWAEDLPKAPGVRVRYPLLKETPSAEPAQRTEWNVRDSDASLILVDAAGVAVSGGTALAERCSAQYAKPLLVVDVRAPDAVERATAWLSTLLTAHSPDTELPPVATHLPNSAHPVTHPVDTMRGSAATHAPDTPQQPDPSFRLAIGGPRESEAPGIYGKARKVLGEVMDEFAK